MPPIVEDRDSISIPIEVIKDPLNLCLLVPVQFYELPVMEGLQLPVDARPFHAQQLQVLVWIVGKCEKDDRDLVHDSEYTRKIE